MIVGLGLDLAEINRVDAMLARHGRRFAGRILTERELSAMPPARAASYLAARFAAKEAASKALGTGLAQGVTFKNLEIVKNALGQPQLLLHGQALERARALRVVRIHLTITHSRDTAAAVVVLEAP
ncbi:holo-ACP synthase [Fundidesulfovibrio butyratiphilus]